MSENQKTDLVYSGPAFTAIVLVPEAGIDRKPGAIANAR